MADAAPPVDSLSKRTAGDYVGCFSSSTPLDNINTYMYQSSGYCSEHCSSAVMGLTDGNQCFCGDQIPAESDKVDDSKCSTKCDGFGQEMCGGDGFWTVYTLKDGATYYGGSDDSGSSSSSAAPSSSKTSPTSTSAAATVVTSEISAGHTSVVTITAAAHPEAAAASSSAASKSGGGSSNTAGIAAGVVVGAVALAGIIAGLFFFIRHKKRKEAEEDYKQRTQVSDFMRGTSERKPPSTGYSGYSDQRLDPEAGARRNSVGSLADNQDYSRRILRVANPDSS
ncbi:hypothetical protein M409DRAFT_20081 [Zasmidium cellare ATCC 36951]|uniref:WSC domain-containing protein n=1 Tax=Zasmidium cellare ATCC 36951 TaxID=1080233 RepID=A0A6A6CVZ2_ZASCE|nr:uncharacterized protein M409DRAFT_20081 [Zasmidium cellare ATCC 36951]KAF2169666.1 hypothetical protein M409DRAFT_20081 [Zasmidium cellare ATCC 36951]